MCCIGNISARLDLVIGSCTCLPLLPLGGSGLMDPCEKTDAAESLTPQQRADITFSAQVCRY